MNELSVRKYEARKASERVLIETVGEVAMAIIRQPITGLALGVAIIEAMEASKIITGALASTMEVVVISGTALSSLSQAVPSAIGLLGAIKK